MNAATGSRKQWVGDLCVIAFLFFFLFGFFQPRYLLTTTITTGGDTGSHYYTAEYLKNHLLPLGRITGWCQGNLAGFPMLQNYFPLPFLVVASLSLVVPLSIAFKVATVSGVFLLPLAAYAFFRLLRWPFPVPAIGASFTLVFLFMEANTMWGGNIPSLLAGEFCFSFGMALAVLWLGAMHRAASAPTGRGGWVGCALLLTLVGFSHAYPLLFAVFSSTYFLLSRTRFKANLSLLFKVHGLAFLLLGFWLVPLIAFLPNTTRFNILWIFFSLGQFQQEALPGFILPFVGLTVLGTVRSIFGRRGATSRVGPDETLGFIWFLIGAGFVLYLLGYRARVVDIRFLPFFQFFLIVSGAVFFHRMTPGCFSGAMLAGVIAIATALWVDANESFIANWIRSNYIGFENRRLWEAYDSVNRFLKGGVADPRVIYEHSMIHQGAGTVRVFECLPLFSGRSTLEGVYIQASPTSPFIFYMQSEFSQNPSTPIPDYNYSRFNLDRGVEHLRLFNVRDVIAAEPQTHRAMDADGRFVRVHESGPYRVYRLQDAPNRYVEPVKFKPVLAPREGWRRLSYEWFRIGDLSVPLVFLTRSEEKKDPDARSRFVRPGFSRTEPAGANPDAGFAGTPVSKPDLKKIDVRGLPAHPATAFGKGDLQEIVGAEEIVIRNAPVGSPLMIKIAYHPNWKVTGADKIYLVSPAFMLIYPNSPRVRLYYGRSWPDAAGQGLSTLGLLIVLLSVYPGLEPSKRKLARVFDRCCIPVFLPILLLVVAGGAVYLFFRPPEFPVLRYNKGIDHFTKKDYTTAKTYFKQVVDELPQTILVDQAAFHYAMCFYLEKDWERTIVELNHLLEMYPETRRAAEALYHIGLCHMGRGDSEMALGAFDETIRRFPDSLWAEQSRDRTGELRVK